MVEITLKTAQLAKEKNFAGICNSYYEENKLQKSGISDNWNSFKEIYSAPLQEELQAWLRDKGINIWVSWFYHEKREKNYYLCRGGYRKEGKTFSFDEETSYLTYEEALERGIKRGLNLL